MRRFNKTSNYIRNIVIVLDFLVLNILFLLYINSGDAVHDIMGSCSKESLLVVANLAFALAQFLFANVVYNRRATSDQIMRQVSSLGFVYLIASYLLTRLNAYLESAGTPSPTFTLYFSLMLYAVLLLSRFVEQWVLKSYRRSGRDKRHVIFVGNNPALLSIYDRLISDSSSGYNVNGYYSDAPISDCPTELRLKGSLADLEKVMETDMACGMADELYCGLPMEDSARIIRIMRYCNNNVVHFYYVPAVNYMFGQMFVPEMVGETTVFTNYDEPLMSIVNKTIKRIFDIVVSLIAIVVTIPLFPFIALTIKLQSPGPVFFKQKRTGINGREFYCYKFRSMHINNDADIVQATEHDPRKFAFGDFMRKTNIDELPQFWNVLKGDMSVVGPRPHMLRHTEVYRKLIDKYMVRHFVKPGITGWAQVTGFRGETKELWQMEGRVKRDIWYIENWSIWLDIRICWRTLRQLFIHDKNAY